MKKIGLAVFTVAAIASMSMSAFAGQWKDTAQGRRYMNDDGTYKKAELFQDETNGAYYLVDDNGYMVTGDMKFNGSSYYFYDDGTMARNVVFQDTSEAATVDGTLVKLGTDSFLLGERVINHDDGDIIYVTVQNFGSKPITMQDHVELTGDNFSETWYAYDKETEKPGKEYVIQPMETLTAENGHVMLIYYSLGNLISGNQDPAQNSGALGCFNIKKAGDEILITDSELVKIDSIFRVEIPTD